MSYDTKKDKYLVHQDQIALVNEIYDGIDTAKKHLQQYVKEENEDFNKRKEVATLRNFVSLTIDTMTNITFRKDIDFEGVTNTDVLWWMESIDLINTMDYFAKQVYMNARKDGKTYIMVDSPRYDSATIKTKQDIRLNNIRPYFVNVKRENVINWEGDSITHAKWVVIREYITKSTAEFEDEIEVQYRVLYNDGRVRIYDDNGQVQEFQTELDFIPLVEVGKRDVPQFYDQAKINVNWLNRNSELENYVRIGGSPFIAMGGQRSQSSKIETIAIDKGLAFNDQNFKVEWVEMTGQNAQIIETRIKKHEEDMLSYSVEMLTDDNIKTATQVNKETAANESKLKYYAKELEEGISKALEMMGAFVEGGLGENTIMVNKDFDNAILTAEEAESYRQDYIQGIISLDKLWSIYEKGERLAIMTEKERTTEKALLKDQMGDI